MPWGVIENFFIVGAWDGSHIWCQWDHSGPPLTEWQVRLRYGDRAKWADWLPNRKCGEDWFRFATNQPSATLVQGQILVGKEEWLTAQEAEFGKPKCRFEFRSQNRVQHYTEGTIFTRAVDGAPCSYRLLEEIEIGAGDSLETEMEATTASGWSQLDRPGDFMLRPSLGVFIKNVAPSEKNLFPTGRDFTVLSSKLGTPGYGGPVQIAITPRSVVR